MQRQALHSFAKVKMQRQALHNFANTVLAVTVLINSVYIKLYQAVCSNSSASVMTSVFFIFWNHKLLLDQTDKCECSTLIVRHQQLGCLPEETVWWWAGGWKGRGGGRNEREREVEVGWVSGHAIFSIFCLRNTLLWVCVCVGLRRMCKMCVCVCVCVWERERERESLEVTRKLWKILCVWCVWKSVCVCVCVWEREWEWKRESVQSDERGRGKGRGCKCRSSMVKVHWLAQLHYFEPLSSPTPPLNHHPPLPILAAALRVPLHGLGCQTSSAECWSGMEIYTALANFDRTR